MADPLGVRKCYELCRSTLRNAGFYEGVSAARLNRKSQFVICASNNFLDMAFLDWCKIFADAKGKHHWSKILPQGSDFRDRLLNHFAIDEAAFAEFTKTVAHYRDKEVAHADIYTEIDIPTLEFVVRSTIFLYEALRAECGHEPTPAAPTDLAAAFDFTVEEGRQHASAMATLPRG